MAFIQLARVLLVVKKDEAFDPVDIRLLRTDAVMLASNGISDLVQQSRLLCICCFRFCH
jgi:hypothetical protein